MLLDTNTSLKIFHRDYVTQDDVHTHICCTHGHTAAHHLTAVAVKIGNHMKTLHAAV